MCNFNNDFSFQVKKITSSNSIRPSAPRSLILKPRGQLARANCADKAQLIVWYLSCSCMLPSNARLRRDSAWSVVIFQRGSDVATSSKDKWETQIDFWHLNESEVQRAGQWLYQVPHQMFTLGRLGVEKKQAPCSHYLFQNPLQESKSLQISNAFKCFPHFRSNKHPVPWRCGR